MEDLWPDIEITQVRTPISILKEQAQLLGQKTQNIVKASIQRKQLADTTTSKLNQIFAESSGKEVDTTISPPAPFQCDFFIEAPALDYKYRLFYIRNSVDLYPVDCVLDSDLIRELSPTKIDNKFVVPNEDQFLKLLERIFKANKTKRIISALFSQST